MAMFLDLLLRQFATPCGIQAIDRERARAIAEPALRHGR
jgi:hypothetical protein